MNSTVSISHKRLAELKVAEQRTANLDCALTEMCARVENAEQRAADAERKARAVHIAEDTQMVADYMENQRECIADARRWALRWKRAAKGRRHTADLLWEAMRFLEASQEVERTRAEAAEAALVERDAELAARDAALTQRDEQAALCEQEVPSLYWKRWREAEAALIQAQEGLAKEREAKQKAAATLELCMPTWEFEEMQKAWKQERAQVRELQVELRAQRKQAREELSALRAVAEAMRRACIAHGLAGNGPMQQLNEAMSDGAYALAALDAARGRGGEKEDGV